MQCYRFFNPLSLSEGEGRVRVGKQNTPLTFILSPKGERTKRKNSHTALKTTTAG